MTKEFKIGLIVTSGIFMLYWGANFLSGSNVFSPKDYFYAKYENVNGLLISNEVRYEGFKVGMVDEITFQPDKSGKSWLVKFSIGQEGMVVLDSCYAEITSADILGTMVIELRDINKGKAPIEPNDTLRGKVAPTLQESVDAQLKPLQVKAEQLISSADKLINTFTTVMNEETQNSLETSINKIPKIINNIVSSTQSLDSITDGLKKARIQDIINNVESITKNIRNNNQSITAALKNIENITDSLAKANLLGTIERVNGVLGTAGDILTKVDEGKGSLGLLLNDAKLYDDLVYAVSDLDFLLMDMRQNPNRYIHFSAFNFGSKKQKDLAPRDEKELKEYLKPLVKQVLDAELDSIKNIVPDSTNSK